MGVPGSTRTGDVGVAVGRGVGVCVGVGGGVAVWVGVRVGGGGCVGTRVRCGGRVRSRDRGRAAARQQQKEQNLGQAPIQDLICHASDRSTGAQVDDSYPLAALFLPTRLERAHLGMSLERLAHHIAQLSGAFSVDNAHPGQSCQVCGIQITIQSGLGVVGALAAQVQLQTGGGGKLRSTWLGRARCGGSSGTAPGRGGPETGHPDGRALSERPSAPRPPPLRVR